MGLSQYRDFGITGLRFSGLRDWDFGITRLDFNIFIFVTGQIWTLRTCLRSEREPWRRNRFKIGLWRSHSFKSEESKRYLGVCCVNTDNLFGTKLSVIKNRLLISELSQVLAKIFVGHIWRAFDYENISCFSTPHCFFG